MIIEYQKFRLPDLAGKNELLIEVNWDKDPKNYPAKILKLTYPDGKQAFVKREFLNSLLFVLGNPEEQRKMIPQTITTVRKYATVLGITAKKDIKKGEQINCAVEIDLPAVVSNIIGEIRGEKTKSGIIKPAIPKMWQK